MKKIILSLSVLTGAGVYAQTGINNTAPKATLDITAKNTDGSTPEGLLTPRLTGDEIKAMIPKLTPDQNGLLIYATEGVTSTTPETQNILVPGYYRLQVTRSGESNSFQFIRLEPSGLEKIRNSAGEIGWRYIGEDRSQNGSYNGKHSTDFSYATGGTYGSPDADAIPTLKGFNIENIYTGGSEVITPYNYSLPSYYVTGGIAFNRPDIFGASGDYSMATGFRTIASGPLSYAGGMDMVAAGIGSFAHGFMGYARGEFTIAMGYGAMADGAGAIAIGGSAKGEGALGLMGNAQGAGSVAIGRNSISLSKGGITLGFSTTETNPEANGESDQRRRQFVVGNSLHISSADSPRSDAFTILRNAKAGLDVDNFENTTSDAKLQINGTIKIGDNGTTDTNGVYLSTTGMPCNSNNEGSMRYYKSDASNGSFQGCKQTAGSFGWVNLNP